MRCSYQLDADWVLCPKCGLRTKQQIPASQETSQASLPSEGSYVEQTILSCVDSLRVSLGRQTICDLLRGSRSKKIVERGFHRHPAYGSLGGHSTQQVLRAIDRLLEKGKLRQEFYRHEGSFPRPVITRPEQSPAVSEGELQTSPPPDRSSAPQLLIEDTPCTASEEEFLREHAMLLKGYNPEQRRAIITPAKRVLCIAGAGSGKTTVLTQRIAFMVKNQGVDPKQVLAITFTRRAAQEMRERLLGVADGATIATFNSFAENCMRQYEDVWYDRPYRVLSYRQQKKLLRDVCTELRVPVQTVLATYFGEGALRRQPLQELLSQWFDEILSIVDYLKSEDLGVETILDNLAKFSSYQERKVAEWIHDIIRTYMSKMAYIGLRDYTDQVLHCYRLLMAHDPVRQEMRSRYRYIFVDEYQDINTLQAKLVQTLLDEESSFFAVGDPRQSIFGFRGSDVRHLLSFREQYPAATVITLRSNYRCPDNIVDLSNRSIKELGVHDQEGVKGSSEETYLIECVSEEKETEFIAHYVARLIKEGVPPHEIFVLSRTNSQLEPVGALLDRLHVPFLLKTIENGTVQDLSLEGKVLLSTIHAAKGLEASVVFVMGLVSSIFPSRSRDKPLLRQIKELRQTPFGDEERRLFYVALTRTKERLFLTYYLSRNRKKILSSFLTDELTTLLKFDRY